MTSKRQIRVGKKLENLLFDIKTKNKVPLWQAGDLIADFVIENKKSKKIKKRIIREIEF